METGPRLKVSSDRLVKPEIQPATPGLQGKRLIHYTTAAPIIFLILNQNICCGYSKEPSQWDSSFEHSKHMLKLILKKFVYLNLCIECVNQMLTVKYAAIINCDVGCCLSGYCLIYNCLIVIICMWQDYFFVMGLKWWSKSRSNCHWSDLICQSLVYLLNMTL